MTKLLFLVGVVLVGATGLRAPGGVAISDLFFMSSVAIWVVRGSAGGTHLISRRYVAISLALITAGGLLSSINAQDALGSLAALAKFLFSLTLFLCFGPTIFKHEGDINLLRAAVLSVILNASGAFIEFTSGGNLFGYETYGRLSGFSEHPNELGLHGALGLFWAAIIVMKGRRLDKALGVAGLVGALYCLIGAASMTAIAASACAVLVYMVLAPARRKWLRALASISALAVCTGVALLQLDGNQENFVLNRILRQMDEDVGDTTLGSRLSTYNLAIMSIATNPLVGVGGSDVDSTLPDGMPVHNTFLKVMFEGGVLQLAGVLSLFGGVARELRGRLKSGALKTREVSAIEWAIYVALIVLISFAPVTYRRLPWLPILIIFAAGRQLRVADSNRFAFKHRLT